MSDFDNQIAVQQLEDAELLKKAKLARASHRARVARLNAGYSPEKRKAAAHKAWSKRRENKKTSV